MTNRYDKRVLIIVIYLQQIIISLLQNKDSEIYPLSYRSDKMNILLLVLHLLLHRQYEMKRIKEILKSGRKK